MANVRMRAPKGFGSVSWNRQEYTAKNGFVVVPQEAVRHVLPHGLKLEDDGAKDDGKQSDGSQA
ncbi:MAG: hypothetical protein ACYCT1_15825 [Steroidobacteraceae bacterium]